MYRTQIAKKKHEICSFLTLPQTFFWGKIGKLLDFPIQKMSLELTIHSIAFFYGGQTQRKFSPVLKLVLGLAQKLNFGAYSQ